jgi:uncharacterized protein DUF4345
MATVVIVVIGVFYLAMGAYALIAPAALVRPFRIVADTPEARSEVRAVYGGFGVAMGVLLGVAALGAEGIRSGVVIAAGTALAGMAVGRVVSRVVDRGTAFYPIWFYFVVETVMAGLLFAAA